MAHFRKQSQKSRELFLDAVIRLIYRLGFHVVVRLRRLGFPRKPGVAVVIWHAGQVLAVQHSYIRGLGIPGGAIDAGETPQLAAVREMKEELGFELDIKDLTPCGNLRNTEVFRTVLATMPEIHVDNREIIEAFFMDPNELIAKVSRYAEILQPPTDLS
jgi:8-oxo-dGTP diphosphatase